MKKETREKILGLGLATILASVPVAGVTLSCAGVMPVYTERAQVDSSLITTQTNLHFDFQGVNFYREVWSNAKKLEISLETELDGQVVSEITYRRYEPAHSAVCERQELHMRAESRNTDYKFEIFASDYNCDGDFDFIVADVLNGRFTEQDNIGALLLSEIPVHMRTVDRTCDIGEQVNAWHERKGL